MEEFFIFVDLWNTRLLIIGTNRCVFHKFCKLVIIISDYFTSNPFSNFIFLFQKLGIFLKESLRNHLKIEK